MKGSGFVAIFFAGSLLVSSFAYVGAAQSSSAFQHVPYAEQMCDACHDSDKPSSDDIIDEPPALCYNCHDEFAKKFVHAPVSIGACLICHNPHESQYKFVLNEKIPDLCYLCHERMQRIMTDEKNVKHSPAIDSCVSCHNPHTSDISRRLLQADTKTLCTECHIKKSVPMEKYVATVSHKHKPVEEDGRCAQCHTPHASPFDFHLRAEPMDVCLGCHNKEVTAYDGKVLTNIAQLLKDNPDHHGPIREKDCAGCHDPHGSDYFRILRAAYPKEFYTEEFSVENFDLCFSCHDSALVEEKETTTLTNFRDGKRNLHYLHVHRERKGRTCRACHETHASTHPKHIRDAVPFGKIRWPLRLQYRIEYADVSTGEPCDTPSETCVKTGGSCIGCHARSHYNYRKAD
jgi:predicted CXXCH cytochrome family protein